MSNTAILRRDLLVEFGGQFPELKSYSDDFTNRNLALRYGACFIPEPLAINHQSTTGYATAVNQDENIREQILINSNALIVNRYSSNYPAKLIARTNARHLFRILCSKLDNFETRTQALIQKTKPMEKSSLILFVIRFTVIALKLIYFSVLRFSDIPKVVLSKLWQKRSPSAS